MKYNEITKEQWEIYRAVDRACKEEDLDYILTNDYDLNIDELTEKQINDMLCYYYYYDEENNEWEHNMKTAIERVLNKGE